MQERIGVAGSGAIACGLAATAARFGEVVLVARSDASADRARDTVHKVCGRLSGEVNAAHVHVETEFDALSEVTMIVEAVVEDHDAKSAVLRDAMRVANADAIIATTTSSLSIEALALEMGAPERFVGLHVFNPVPRMKLVELAFPKEATAATRERVNQLCHDLGKTAVEVPDVPGFVVNRLLFPYLFSAVDYQQETGLSSEGIDTCMALGAGHPMGPLALLDFVGLDVAVAIGDEIGVAVPARVRELVDEGALGKKTGRGFYEY